MDVHDDHGDTPRRTVEKLDLEDEEGREKRIQSVLEKLNTTAAPQKKKPIFPSFEFINRPYAIKPPTELLSRVQAFLPQMEASNGILAERMQADPRSVDIENIEEGMDQYIEMNLGLGVFEDRSHRKSQDYKDATMSASSSSDAEFYGLGEDDSDFDSDSSSEIITSFHPIRPIKPLPKRKAAAARPHIVVLGEETKII